jgi:alcohol dehydrogenase class IV
MEVMDRMLPPFLFNLPTKIIFGAGKLESELGVEASKLGRKAFIVTGRSSTKRTGLLERVTTILAKNRIECSIFDRVESNPSVETVEQGAELAQESKTDFLIGLGGGSPLDAAKAIGILLSQGGRISDYFGRA